MTLLSHPGSQSQLDEELDTAIEGKEFEKAVSMSDKMAQREVRVLQVLL